MTRVLHLNASPKGLASVSLRLADAFLDTLRREAPDTEVDRLNLFEADLPPFGRTAAEAKFAPILGQERTAEQAAAWEAVLAEIARFDLADKVLLSCPMWNYSIPYPLKHYLDLIVQPRVTVGYDPIAMLHKGLLKNRPVQLILTRSSVMPGDFADFQLPYLRFILDVIGLRDLTVVTAWRTTRPNADEREAYVRSFDSEIADAARAFARKPGPVRAAA